MLQSIEATIYRAGTSRGPYFLASDLPSGTEERDAALLSIMGSGHPLQIDGLGGGNTLTSKVAIVSKSVHPEYDVDYLFCQVGVHERTVDTGPNCGNMMTGVASFAVERGLVRPNIDETSCIVRVYNINTGQVSELLLPVHRGRVHYDEVDDNGILRPCARVGLRFLNTVGARTGKLLPTGRPVDVIEGVEVSIIDSAVPVVFVRQEDVGVTGEESSVVLNANQPLLDTLERIRLQAGVRMGLGDVSKSVLPKISLIRNGTSITTFTARYFTPKSCHNAHAVTGAICTAGAAFTPGTIVWEMYQRRRASDGSSAYSSLCTTPALSPSSSTPSLPDSAAAAAAVSLVQGGQRRISIEHPSGVIDVGLAPACEERPDDVGVAFVDRTVALIAHARVFYAVPTKVDKRTPITSPSIVGHDQYFSRSYRPVYQKLDAVVDPLFSVSPFDV